MNHFRRSAHHPSPARRRLGIGLIVVGAAFLAARLFDGSGTAQARGDDRRVTQRELSEDLVLTHSVPSGGSYTLQLDQGEIQVVPTDGREARLVVELDEGRPESLIVKDESGPEGVRLSLEGRGNGGWLGGWFSSSDRHDKGDGDDVSIAGAVLELPRGVDLHLATGAGDLDLADLDGSLKASTGAGNVAIDHCRGHVRLSTGAGDVTVSSPGGEVDVKTGAGDLLVSDTTGQDVTLRTGAGSIQVAGNVARCSASTGMGSIEADLDGLTGDTQLKTGMGSVSVSLGAGVSANISAGSGMGDVSLHSGDGSRIESQHGERLKAQVGSADIELRVSTGMGSIEVVSEAPVRQRRGQAL
ncbi:MAG: DUF4097 family beta strand repeat-containing protein [Acidobacteriota bacterium]